MSADIPALFTKLAKATPKTDLAVFAGRVGGRLMDNVKYLFRHVIQHKQPYTSVFLTHHQAEHEQLQAAGLPSLLFPSDEALQLLPRAKLVVADDFWFKTQTPAYYLLSRAKTLQMWHGIPLKLIGFPEIDSGVNMTPEKAEHLRFGYSGYDAAISTSPFVTKTSLGKVFQAKEMWETGYPRNDALLRDPDRMDLMGVDLAAYERMRDLAAKGWKIVLFMPTFRDTGGDPFSDHVLDPAVLEAFGRRHKIAFGLKFHPYISMDADLGLEAVFVVKPDTDAYPLLRVAHCLLTDYSSVAYDFLLTDKPQIFLPYDLEKYLSRDRGMFYPFEDMAPGPKALDQAQLIAALKDVLVRGNDAHATERAELRAKLFSHPDGKAAERVAERLLRTFFA